MEEYHGNTVEYWKHNAEKDYSISPISVLKYISVLEEQVGITLDRVNKYAAHQHYRGTIQQPLVEFEEWRAKD